MFDVLPDVRFFIKNLQGRYVFASQTLLDAHGFADPEAIIGQTDHDFIPAWLADHYVRDDRKVLAGAAIRNRIELVIRLDGMPTWHSTSKLPLHNVRGKICGLAGVSRDLGEATRTLVPFARLAPVLDYVQEHYAEPIQIRDLARLTHLSLRSFERQFKATFQVSPTDYLREFRVGRACQLLIETDETITGIAAATGFSDHSHLIRIFARSKGLTPGEFRRRYRHG